VSLLQPRICAAALLAAVGLAPFLAAFAPPLAACFGATCALCAATEAALSVAFGFWGRHVCVGILFWL